MRHLSWFLLPIVVLACIPALAAAPELPAVRPDPAPATDPAEANVPELVTAVQGKHPRLVFSATDVPAMQKLAQGDGKAFFKQLEEYLGSSVAPTASDYLTDDTDGIVCLPGRIGPDISVSANHPRRAAVLVPLHHTGLAEHVRRPPPAVMLDTGTRHRFPVPCPSVDHGRC